MDNPESLFDVERFRTEPRRLAVVREVLAPTLVLGSTQPPDVVAHPAVRARGVTLARRRGGGGAVYLAPGDPLWLDAWIPRHDPLWRRDVSVATGWVGQWWLDALAPWGLHGLEIHAGRAVPGELGDLVCFAGRGPGEVFQRGRKVVGLSQWRAREGALFSSCAYLHWDPRPLAELLEADGAAADGLARELAPLAAGLDDIEPELDAGPDHGRGDLSALAEALLGSFAGYGTDPSPDGTPGPAQPRS